MVGLFLGFETFLNLALFCVLSAVFSLWANRCFINKQQVSLWLLIAVNVVLLIFWSRTVSIDMDEVEHLHCAWLVAQGLIPFVNFWQHHSPLLWVAMAPIMKVIPESSVVFELSRLCGAFVFAAIGLAGWSICRRAWGKDARLSIYILLLSSAAILGEYLWLRPDVFMVLFLLAGVLFCFDIPGKRLLPSFFAGAAFALAMSFITKQYLVCLLPVIVIAWERHKYWPVKLVCLILGVFTGFAPLLWYLFSNKIFSEFIAWVCLFNSKLVVVSVVLPAAFGIGAILGGAGLVQQYRLNKDIRLLVLPIGFLLSTLSSFTGLVALNGGYYLAFWFVLAASTGSSISVWRAAGERLPVFARAAVIGLLLAGLIMPNIIAVVSKKSSSFLKDKTSIAQLMDYCRDDVCLVLLPMHPVFCRDVSRLFSFWQFNFTARFNEVKEDASSQNIAKAIIARKPAVILCRYRKRDFILELFQKDLISAEDYKELAPFLKSNYTIRRIGQESYYIRSDRL